MTPSEIISYFASKGMGSSLLSIVDVIWERLDEIEKQMAVSLHKLNTGAVGIRSKLSQKELEEEIQQTPFISFD